MQVSMLPTKESLPSKTSKVGQENEYFRLNTTMPVIWVLAKRMSGAGHADLEVVVGPENSIPLII